MERWAAVCGADEIRTYRLCGTPPVAAEAARTQLQEARALCYHAGTLFCASGWGDTLWQMDARTLAPLRVLPLGPGVSRLISTPGGDAVYALCEDADSVLMLSAQSGQPLVLARSGVQPRDMRIDASGRHLLVAAGAACEAEVYCAQTLRRIRRIQTPGLCAGAAFTPRGIATISMTEQTAGMICEHGKGGRSQTLRLIDALPGGLLAGRRGVLALYWGGAASIAWDGRVTRSFPMDGLTQRACVWEDGMILCQPSVPRCMLWTEHGAQTLRGGSDVCVYEMDANAPQ